MIIETPTGKTRHRSLNRWFRKPLLVLQIEVHRKGIYYSPDPQDHSAGLTVDETSWRDACTEDLRQ